MEENPNTADNKQQTATPPLNQTPPPVRDIPGNQPMGKMRHAKTIMYAAICVMLAVIIVAWVFSKPKVVLQSTDPAVTKAIQQQAAAQSATQYNDIKATLDKTNAALSNMTQLIQNKQRTKETGPNINSIEKASKNIDMLSGLGKPESGSLDSQMLKEVTPPKAPSLVRQDLSMATPKGKPTTVAALDPKRQKHLFLPAGTVVEGVMVTGAFAPVKGAPLTLEAPTVLIRLTRNGITANFHTFPLKDAFILAKAEGIWNLSRVTMDTKKLDMVLPSGKTIEVAISGQIQGADHIDGVPGIVVNPGQSRRELTYLFGELGSGFFAGMASAQTNNTTNAFGTATQNVKNTLMYSTFAGLSKTWDTFSQWYLDQAKQLTPFVVAKPGSKVYLLVQNGIDLTIDENDLTRGA